MGIRVSFMTVFGALLVGISGCSSVMLPLGVAHLRTQLGTLVLAQGVFQRGLEAVIKLLVSIHGSRSLKHLTYKN